MQAIADWLPGICAFLQYFFSGGGHSLRVGLLRSFRHLPDQSVNFLLDELLDMKQIGISLTENGAMYPHASFLTYSCIFSVAASASRSERVCTSKCL